MTLIIVAFLLIGYCLIATEHITKINKAAVAMFLGVVAWILYMCDGTHFVLAHHKAEYMQFLHGSPSTWLTTKTFIAHNIFLGYTANIAEIVLFLLATMYIVEVLDNNGCFDFIRGWLRTRSSRRLLWGLVGFTYLISANLDNLTTTIMMLVIMHGLVQNRAYRRVYGSAIILAANCGGLFTVIGDVTSLMLWVKGAVTPTEYSAALFLPSLAALALPTYLMSRMLPDHLDSVPTVSTFRGNDTILNSWQRIIMLVVGLGGLWFITTFHRITQLSPFVGALCVLSLLWIVHEICNRKLMNADQMAQRRIPRPLQYSNIQTILFFIGLSLAVGALQETGALHVAAQWCDTNIHNIYLMSLILGVISSVLDNIALVLSSISMYDVVDAHNAVNPYLASFTQNGLYWELVSYSGAVGGTLLTIGSTTGFALMKFEKVSLAWYARHITLKVLLGWLFGLGIFFLCQLFF